MATNAKPVYKRILLKLSGEALQGSKVSVLMQASLTAWRKKSKNWLNWVFRLGW
jgi:uridylate kinase